MSSKLFIIATVLILACPPASKASDYNLQNPKSYVLQKFKSNDIVLLGTRHKQKPILKLIQDFIPKLPKAGVTHIGLEIASDQQPKIDYYMNTGEGLSQIQIHPIIDCSAYRNNLIVLQYYY